MEKTVNLITPEAEKIILDIFKRGNNVILKKINGQLQIVEVKQKLIKKTPITG